MILKKNPAALLSSAWYLTGDGSGKRDMVVLPYRDRLQVFSKYLQQLVMESLGKKFNRDGEVVNQGISVFGNKGSTDQHAYVQQLRDGIDNFFCIFIELLDSPRLIFLTIKRILKNIFLVFCKELDQHFLVKTDKVLLSH